MVWLERGCGDLLSVPAYREISESSSRLLFKRSLQRQLTKSGSSGYASAAKCDERMTSA